MGFSKYVQSLKSLVLGMEQDVDSLSNQERELHDLLSGLDLTNASEDYDFWSCVAVDGTEEYRKWLLMEELTKLKRLIEKIKNIIGKLKSRLLYILRNLRTLIRQFHYFIFNSLDEDHVGALLARHLQKTY
jgi:hypothetical protein